jgi:hypothetical protein
MITFFLSGCYTFKDISIKPDVKTFYVDEFKLNANAPGNLSIDFTEELKRRILSETRLTYDENDPHIFFEGSIEDYRVESTATTAQNTSALNKLRLRIKISYTNVLHEDENWENSFSESVPFDQDVNLADVQDELIDEMFDLIIESVINKAFSNW